MSSTLTLCGRMIIASTNYQTDHSGVAFATLAARVLGSFWAGWLLKKLNRKRQKKGPFFVRIATAAQKIEISHGTYIQPGPAPTHRCPAELRAFIAWCQPGIGRLIEYWVDDRPESGTTRSDLGRLLSWRCMLGALLECHCHRQLSPNPGELSDIAQIFNSTNSAVPLFKIM